MAIDYIQDMPPPCRDLHPRAWLWLGFSAHRSAGALSDGQHVRGLVVTLAGPSNHCGNIWRVARWFHIPVVLGSGRPDRGEFLAGDHCLSGALVDDHSP